MILRGCFLESDKLLAIIPARGASKGVRIKNIRSLNGVPLIVYTIEAAKNCKYNLRTIVSTDSEEIAEISQKYGAEIPFIRPKELARDETPTLPVLQHAINFLREEENYYPDTIVLLQATSPLRMSRHIDEAMDIFFKGGSDSVVSLCEVRHSPYWMRVIDRNGRVRQFIETDKRYARRQDLPKIYNLNGAIYISQVEVIMERNRVLGEDTRAYIMKEKNSVDIDTEIDFKIADLILKKKYKLKEHGKIK
jgi:N-acylneuraminate cytidylyltransferase/CMP-N,N'-diacetyllegionaminic acid synthase